jgi:aryl-alcohol dehydrogenase-like predicted oxidoreductase
MEKRNFGGDGELVSLLGYGAWGIGKAFWGETDDKESMRSLRRAIDAGVNFFDSALVYGRGHSERLVGKAERDSGKKLFLTTKIPSKKMEWPASDNSRLEDSFPTDYIIETTEKSLRNLGRDYVDLQQFHVWNDKWAERDEWKEGIRKLKESGKVRYFGISINDHQPANGIEAGKYGLIDSYQVIFNLFDQSPADELLPFCATNNIAVIARVPLDEGGLTGTITADSVFPDGDWRSNYFRDERKKEVAERAAKILTDVQDECENLPDAALRYLAGFAEVTTIIPGMRREKNLIANVASVQRGSLSPELMEKMKAHRWVRNFYK